MSTAHIEYVDFTTTDRTREYRLRVRLGPESQEVQVTVPNEAFRRNRLRFQDGPEVCYLKLQRALVEGEGSLPEGPLEVTDAEIEDYRVAHSPKKSRR